MDSKKKIYLLYATIFVLIMVFGVINFLFRTADIWRSNLPKYEYVTILPKDLVDLMSQNNELIIVDSRIPPDFKEGHIKGAINLSYTNLKKMVKVLKKEAGKEIVIYSEDGERSKKICEILSNLGFSRLRNLDGGIKGWIDSDGDIVRS